MGTGVIRVSTLAYTRTVAEAQIGAEIRKATEKLSVEGKEVTSIQQEQPFKGATFWKIYANISWRTVDNSSAQQQILTAPQITISTNASTESLLKRVHLFLEDGEWEKANAYCENSLDQNPECADAYLCKLLAELKLDTIEKLKNEDSSFIEHPFYKKAVRFADSDFKTKLEEIEHYFIEQKRQEDIKPFNEAKLQASKLSENSTLDEVDGIIKEFETAHSKSLIDSSEFESLLEPIKIIRDQIVQKQKIKTEIEFEEHYKKAIAWFETLTPSSSMEDIRRPLNAFASLHDYKDAKEYYEKCKTMFESKKKKKQKSKTFVAVLVTILVVAFIVICAVIGAYIGANYS